MADASTESDAAAAAAQRRTTVVSIITASWLMVLMLGVGLAASSLGLISTGIESTGDVAAVVVTFLAVRLGARPAASTRSNLPDLTGRSTAEGALRFSS